MSPDINTEIPGSRNPKKQFQFRYIFWGMNKKMSLRKNPEISGLQKKSRYLKIRIYTISDKFNCLFIFFGNLKIKKNTNIILFESRSYNKITNFIFIIKKH